MLDLWRPPQGAGDPIGCLATTYTFSPGLFDEQCLARFLEIESEPNREDLAFLLERETRLGSVYTGVLVDHTQAGVAHSLRWDVLPVRIRSGKQHAKLSLLAWTGHVRIIVSSANLTEPGYRSNHEVTGTVELREAEANTQALQDAISFLRRLLVIVPAASAQPPVVVQRAEAYLTQVERQVQKWKPIPRSRTVRQQLVFTLPASGAGRPARSSVEAAIEACRGRGGSPDKAWVASPFFDIDVENDSRVSAALCKLMARGVRRKLELCVPAIHADEVTAVPRLAAPKSLLLTPQAYHCEVSIYKLPEQDDDKNRRAWHAKMLGLFGDQYAALMIGSSNFTCAGMGVGQYRNAEANFLTIADRVDYAREISQLEAVWPEMEQVEKPESAEWLGAQNEQEEEEQTASASLPAGFLSATYRAGDSRYIILQFDPTHLPDNWSIFPCGQEKQELLSAATWRPSGSNAIVEIAWTSIQPPEKLLVRWAELEAFLPVNVENPSALPPPAQLDQMTADDMLWIIAAVDPSAAFRAWAKRQQPSDLFDDDLDSATPIDLDPLRRYDLQATFLHRIRHRARILAQLRANLQRPVWSQQALDWRLRGPIGVEPLADRLVREIAASNGTTDEALLTLADFLIVLREVDYQPSDGCLAKAEFEKVFRLFLRELVGKLEGQIEGHRSRISEDSMHFWNRVVERCRG